MKAKAGLVLAILALTGCAERQPICRGPAQARTRVLVIGDSWAAHGALNKPIAQAMGGEASVRVCSIGLKGHTAQEIARDLPPIPERFYQVVVLAGVNDVVRHTGAAQYREGVQEVLSVARAVSPDVRLVAIPRVDLMHPHGDAETHAANAARNDGGVLDVTDTYRAAAPTVAVIPFDPFIPSYAGHERDYKDDGIHLTSEAQERFGQYIGQALTSPSRP